MPAGFFKNCAEKKKKKNQVIAYGVDLSNEFLSEVMSPVSGDLLPKTPFSSSFHCIA